MKNRATIRSLLDSVNPPAIFIPQPGQFSALPDFSRQLPRLFRRCPGFDNDCPDPENRRPGFKSHCPEPIISRPDFGNDCPGLAGCCPGIKSFGPGLVSRCPGSFRFCPDSQTVAPVLKAVALISGAPRLFRNLLPQSNLRKMVGTARCAVRSSQRDDPTATFNLQPSTLN